MKNENAIKWIFSFAPQGNSKFICISFITLLPTRRLEMWDIIWNFFLIISECIKNYERNFRYFHEDGAKAYLREYFINS